ncbi:hypothetical protein Hanom_Chr03g00200041 [Helianthus anomalus]
MIRVGVLAGEAMRIEEVVTLKWKNRCFRIRVEEEQDVWCNTLYSRIFRF